MRCLEFRHDKAIGVIANFRPREVWEGSAGKERSWHGRELDLHANDFFPFGQLLRQEEFIIAKPAVGGLQR